MQVEAFLELSAMQFPEKTALVSGNRRLSYRQLEEQCNQLAHGLIEMGVQRGDRVAVYLDNSVETVLSMFAILKAGAVFTIINPTVKAERLAYTLNNSGPRIVITDTRKLVRIQSCWGNTAELEAVLVVASRGEQFENGLKRIARWDALMASHSECVHPPRNQAIDIDVATLIYTSGSTGTPKGVILSHLNMVAAATSVITYLGNTSDDVILNVLPLSSSYGLYQILTGLKVGGTVVLEQSFTYPHSTLQRVMDERVTGLAIVPTIAAILLQMDFSAYRFPDLRYLTNAGAALPTPHVAKLRERFPKARLYLMYGLTECKRVSYLPPDQLDRRPASVGKAMPNVEAYIVDEHEQRLPPGAIGELVVRGANVMKGYWKLPQETAKALKPGPLPGEQVLHTGDLFRMDEEGYLYWIGRMDDIIKSRGEKVSPRDVENVLHCLDGIAIAAVIGVPDPVLGQAIKAVITLREGMHLTRNDVLRHCARHLQDFMIPTLIEFRESMPKTAAGKIDRQELTHPMGATMR